MDSELLLALQFASKDSSYRAKFFYFVFFLYFYKLYTKPNRASALILLTYRLADPSNYDIVNLPLQHEQNFLGRRKSKIPVFWSF